MTQLGVPSVEVHVSDRNVVKLWGRRPVRCRRGAVVQVQHNPARRRPREVLVAGAGEPPKKEKKEKKEKNKVGWQPTPACQPKHATRVGACDTHCAASVVRENCQTMRGAGGRGGWGGKWGFNKITHAKITPRPRPRRPDPGWS